MGTGGETMSEQAALLVEDVTFAYGQKQVLQHINLRLTAGQFYVLLGPNGAGKSTLFSLLCQLLRPNKGEIMLAGYSSKRHPLEGLARIGVVFQQSTLDLDLSVIQNLRYHAALHGLSNRQAAAAIAQETARMGISEQLHCKVRLLNGGHRRRVEIARALLHKPTLLLLDEATVGLDIPTRQQLNADLRRLCQEDSMTVLASTHLIDDVHEHDQLVLLHRGQVQYKGACSELVSPFSFQHLTEHYQRLTSTGAKV